MPGHLFKVIEIIMIKQFNRRQENPKTRQYRWCGRVSAPNLSATQPNQQIAQGDSLRLGCLLDVPNYDTSHCRNQQSFGNRISSFLLPLIDLEAVTLKQLEVRFDPPT